MEKFVFGIEGLDNLLGNSLARGSLVVIAGHPGSGKTTLASTICYANVLKGHRCLYVSVQEDKEKLFRNVKRLGIDLYNAESRNQLKFVKLPLVVDVESIPEVYIGTINRYVLEYSPSIVIIDSITPILKVIESGAKARAILQNFFFELPKLIDGLVILIAEIPLMEERIEPVDIEFIADTILIMRHSIVGKLLYREIEVRKARGAPLTTARMHFTIAEGQGIKIYVPPLLTEIPSPDIGRSIEWLCREVEEIQYIHPGEIIYISHPLDLFPVDFLHMAIASAIINKARLSIVSHIFSPDYIWYMIAENIRKHLGAEIAIERVRDILKDYIAIEAYNPASYVPEELYYKAVELMEKIKLHMLLIIGNPELATGREVEFLKRYINVVYNLILFFRKLGIVMFYFTVHNRSTHRLFAPIADTTIKIKTTALKNGKQMVHYVITKKGRQPTIVRDESLTPCRKRAIELLNNAIARHPLHGSSTA